MATTETGRTAEWGRQHLYRVMFDDLGICGCNQPDEAYNLVRDLLAYLSRDHADRDINDLGRLIGCDGAVHLVLCQLDNADLAEHGGTVAGAWLTGKGRCVLELMRRHEWENGDDDTEGVDETGYPHGGKDCTPGCWVPREPAPPEPSTAERVDALRKAATEQRAAMTPAQRMFDDAAVDMLLYGEAHIPVAGLPGVLAVRPDGDEIANVITGNLARAAAGSAQALELVAAPRPTQFLAGCRQIGATWIHGRPHSCPKWARG